MWKNRFVQQDDVFFFVFISFWRIPSIWPAIWLLLRWWFWLSIIAPGFFFTAVMATSQPITLCNDRIGFFPYTPLYIYLHWISLAIFLSSHPVTYIFNFSCHKYKYHTPSNYLVCFSSFIKYFLMKIFAEFIHLQ